MKDLGPLHYFLGIQVTRNSNGLTLSQAKYALEILDRSQMKDCKPMGTPMMPKTKGLTCDVPFPDPGHYRSIVGALQYLTLTRSDLAFCVNFVSQFLHSPTMAHYKMVKRILRYLHGTLEIGIHFSSHSTLNLYAFSEADWAGCSLTRRSTTGYCIFLGSNCISWSAKKQNTISRSSSEAEYRAMASTTAEITWISFLLRDLGVTLPAAPILFCDNLSALHMTANPVFHARSKHIEIDYHYVRERVALGLLHSRHIPASSQLADIFTKPLGRPALYSLRTKLGLLSRHSLQGTIENTQKPTATKPYMETQPYTSHPTATKPHMETKILNG
ncbi:hypothetical protein F2P56_036153 [Juglans regia]|uniref:Reverse transcriptase Ty1/copia-type domain-containing protein n=2 Tax=Juglans regia TaxID=51240 RepID=A0A833TY58_JUGRE|nr:uncharacterized mitochondrial protein AtMg00810-like [Juglans regia]KAF5443609.1 hypothetical protein F2P56_036153 [Juglans regia]